MVTPTDFWNNGRSSGIVLVMHLLCAQIVCLPRGNLPEEYQVVYVCLRLQSENWHQSGALIKSCHAYMQRPSLLRAAWQLILIFGVF